MLALLCSMSLPQSCTGHGSEPETRNSTASFNLFVVESWIVPKCKNAFFSLHVCGMKTLTVSLPQECTWDL